MTVRVAVIYYSATGAVHQLAEAVAEGAASIADDVRLRRVPELAPDSAIDANPGWRAHVDNTHGEVAVATMDDLAWATAYAFGTPTRFGNPAAQLRQFIDQTGRLWQEGTFVDKPVTSFTAAQNAHGGQESTILALNNTFYHWGSLIVSPGYTDATVFASGGNPYGASWVSGQGDGPDEAALAVARYQGRRLARLASMIDNEA